VPEINLPPAVGRKVVHARNDIMAGGGYRRKYIVTWMPAAVWAAAILVISLMPAETPVLPSVRYVDKAVHFLIYAVLGALTFRGVCGFSGVTLPKNILFTLISGGGYGIVMELAQGFIPGRHASFYDVLANIAGTVFGIVTGRMIFWRKKQAL